MHARKTALIGIGMTSLALTSVHAFKISGTAPTVEFNSINNSKFPGLKAYFEDKMNAEVNKLLKSKETADQLQTDGVSPKGGTPEAFREQIRKEVALWKKTVAATGVKVE